METGNTIGFLAPEIPALSATFVYKEIQALSRNGFNVLPISIHIPLDSAEGDTLDSLKEDTAYLYQLSPWQVFQSHLRFVLRNPFRYVRGGVRSVSDALRIGLFTRTGIGILYRFLRAVACADILKRKSCCHLHVHFAHVSADIAMYSAGLAGIPFSFTSHANDIFQRGWLLKEKIARSSFAVTISEYNRKYLIEQGGNPDKIHTIHCGVESNEFLFDPKKERRGPVVIGILCRLVEKKGVDVLIRACRLLADNGLPVTLSIAGDGPLRENLEKLAAALKISGQINFTGNLPHDRVANWLKAIDLFVLPCRRDAFGDQDGIPIVLMEAMAAGVNVVSTTISGIPELIENENSGLLVSPDDPKKLANAIKRIVADKDFGERLRANAVSVVKKRFNLDENAEKLSNLIKESLV